MEQNDQNQMCYDLIIDNIVMNKTPQTGTWLFCFQVATESGAEGTYHIPNKTYESDGTKIVMNLKLCDIYRGEKVSFKCYLDNDEGDVCSESAADKSNGDFLAKREGSKTFSLDNWCYIISWHLEKSNF